MTCPAYRFGEFRLDPASRELRRGDEELTLPLKIFDCIAYLVKHRDRAIGRDELIAAVWGAADLSDSALGQSILLARKALDDTGEEQHVIKTVRGFGYRWVAPVEPEVGPTGATVSHDRAPAASRPTRPLWFWLAMTILVAGTLIVGLAHLWRSVKSDDSKAVVSSPAAGEIALMLPVQVTAGEENAWIRLGLMDLLNERLRNAGQAMVSSDTVVALLRGVTGVPSPKDIDRLATATGARLVLDVRAQAAGTRWTVSLHTLVGVEPAMTTVGEAHDVIEAARIGADRMALALGLVPITDADAELDLQLLLQQIRAARLAQQMDVAHALVEQADPRLQQHPEIRFQRGTIEYASFQLDAALATLETLLEETSAESDPVLRARILNSIAAARANQGRWDAAEPLLEEAVRLLVGREAPATLGMIRTNLGAAALERGDIGATREQMARARLIFHGIGDIQKLATLDLSMGVLEARGERYAEALYYFESAAERYAAIQDVGLELHARAYVIAAHLKLLDLESASAVEPRMNELLARTVSPKLAAIAHVSLVDLMNASGRSEAAQTLLSQVMIATQTHKNLDVQRMEALLRVAEYAVQEGNADRAAHTASELLGQLALHPDSKQDETFGRSSLVLVRANLIRGDRPAAAATSAAITHWAHSNDSYSPRIYAALAQAELAAAEGRREAAETAFELALEHAETSRVPLYLLQVVGSYAPWLLDTDTPDLGRALSLADRLIPHLDWHYDAALLQLRVYHAMGAPSAWRAALARTRSLAGERQIPPELLVMPPKPGMVLQK